MNKFYNLTRLGLACALFLGTGAATESLAQRPFPQIDTNFVAATVTVPATPFKYSVLFRQGESMVKTKSGQTAVARGDNDFTAYIPIEGSSTHGYLVVNHEMRDSSTIFGDGGGMTAFEVKMDGGEWKVVGDFRNVDFTGVGGTWINCGGAQTPYGTLLTAEEYPPVHNTELYTGGRQVRDTSDRTITFEGQQRTIRAFESMGWMVEVDAPTATATRKLYKMGRFSHEGGYCMPDGKTVYLTDDFTPAVLFKFVAKVANDYSDGQLYAYKQSNDGESGSWITLPMELDSLINIRNVALRMGATMFVRHEWVTEANGKIYIAETGLDAFQLANEMRMGGTPARHLREFFSTSDTSFVDYYGRVLELDPVSGKIRVLINGGHGQKDRSVNFSNPDGLVTGVIKGKTYLVVNEDLNGRTMGRVNLNAQVARRTVPEIYWVDLAEDNPTTDDLMRFLVGPNGSETTGGRFTPDYKTYFVNIQHPSSSNPEPFNRAATIAITGFDNFSGVTNPGDDDDGSSFRIYPNPASRNLTFNRQADVAVYDAVGKRILAERNTNRIDISDLTPGVYYVQTVEGEVQKLVVE